jgi:hypothetical protein
MDIQMKYIVERNLEVVYHDPETGMPRLVSFWERFKIFRRSKRRRTMKRWTRGRNSWRWR